MDITYKVNYDATTGEIKGIYASNISYTAIPIPYIELSQSEWQALINSSTKKVVNITTKVLEDYVEADAEKLAAAQDSKTAILKALLTRTDYQSNKHADGVITDAQYKALNTRREEWRVAIRAIEACTTVDAVNAVTYSTDIPAVD